MKTYDKYDKYEKLVYLKNFFIEFMILLVKVCITLSSTILSLIIFNSIIICFLDINHFVEFHLMIIICIHKSQQTRLIS